MKKRLVLFFAILVLCTGTVFGATTKIYINGTEVKTSTAPIVKGGVTLVPLKVISEQLGAYVEYDKVDKSIAVYKGDRMVVLFIGEKIMYIYDDATGIEEYEMLGYAPIVQGGTTMVPIRAISSGLGCDIQYNNNTINIVASVMETYLLTDGEEALTKELESKYNSCSTALGNIDFEYTIVEGKREDLSIDYFVMISFKQTSITDQLYSQIGTSEACIAARQQLKAKMQEIGNYLIANHPGKTFVGSYDNGYYLDETKEDTWIDRIACSWFNVEYLDDGTMKLADFIWCPELNDIEW